MSAAEKFDFLHAAVQFLGAAILPIWGVDETGACLCPQGKACRSAGKHPNGKLCPNGVKNATRDPSILRQWLRQAPRSNWAVRCGEAMPDGGFLGVFDWDPRNGSAESIEAIRARGDELPDTVSQASGGGGGHRFYKFPHAPAARAVAPGIDLQGGGKYVVIAPSGHASGGSYTWDLGRAPGEHVVAPAPAWLIDGTNEAQPRPMVDGGSAAETVLGEAFRLAGRAGPVMPNGMMYVNCVQSHTHTDNRGHGEDASTVILPPAGGSRFGGYRCQHGHCANLKWHDVLKMLPAEAVDAAWRKYPRLSVVDPSAAAAAPGPVITQITPPAGGISEDEKAAICLKLSFKESKGKAKIVNDIVNLNTILSYDPRWKGVLQYDEFAQALRFAKEPPWHEQDAGRSDSVYWQDADVTRMDMWLRREWGVDLKVSQIYNTAYVVGLRESINPLRDYLNGLVWDRTPRIDKWLTNYAGVASNSYTRTAGRKWLLSAVARGYEPGCKVDTLLVLEGPQGKGKSTLLRTLVPVTSWFSDTPIAIGDKDAYVALRGKWIMELAELASLKKADLDRAKAFFSSPVDSYRPPYGRELVSVPRSCVFAGTVNLQEYLTDSTGGRRFIPVACGTIDVPSLAEDRDQIWAETVTVYKSWVERGCPQSECLWWPSYEELPAFEAEQEKRLVADEPHIEATALWLSSEHCKTLVEKYGFILVRDVAKYALHMLDKDIDHNMLVRIALGLRKLGWARRRVTFCGARTWGYTKGH